jgi:hypothetical protein
MSIEKRWATMLTAAFGCAVGTAACAIEPTTDGEPENGEVGTITQAYVGQPCTSHSNCASNEICSNNTCQTLSCTGCTYAQDHTCKSDRCGTSSSGSCQAGYTKCPMYTGYGSTTYVCVWLNYPSDGCPCTLSYSCS